MFHTVSKIQDFLYYIQKYNFEYFFILSMLMMDNEDKLRYINNLIIIWKVN